MKRIVAVVAVGLLALLLLPSSLGMPSALGTPSLPAGATTAIDAGVPLAAPEPAARPPAQGPGLDSTQDLNLIDRLQAAGGSVEVAAHLRTGRARFVGADAQRPDFRGIETGIRGRPEAAARAFLAEYGPLFGISHVESLVVIKERTLGAGATARDYIRYQQTINGIPVMGGELIVQADASGRVWSASGEALPDDAAEALPVEPKVSAEDAARTALAAAAKYEQAAADNLTVSVPELWYYYPDLLGAPGPAAGRLVWRLDVTANDLSPVRELVLVDAITGKVPLHFNQVPHAKDRVVYDNDNDVNGELPGFGPVRSEGQGPSGNHEVDRAYDYAGDTYDFYLSRYGRDSIDGKGMQLISTVKYCPDRENCPFQNAFWSGQQMVYGDGYAGGDDVVAHELTHGVTDYEANLFYYMQSGALNESFSDIWGEYIDLTNGKGNDKHGVRWLIGEDIPIGAIRNMANPSEFGDPDSMGSPDYKCDPSDGGRVHSNSGVSNMAAVLLTDGGSLNGATVTGLGLEKSAQIWYRMATQLLTSGAEYQDVYNLLPQACLDLARSGAGGVTRVDCQQVKNAVTATQMNEEAGFCASAEAPVCPVGQVATDVYNESFENTSLSLGRWISGADVGPKPWYYPQTSNPYNYSMYYAGSGLYHLWGDNLDRSSDGWMEMKNQVTVPLAGHPYFRFRHAFAFETDFLGNYDAGVLEYSANGGPWTDAGRLFLDNGYNGPIDGSPNNSLFGRDGFVGLSWGYGSSRLSLSSFKGQTLKFRFRVASDDLIGNDGWFVDDVRLYTCMAAPQVWMPVVVR